MSDISLSTRSLHCLRLHGTYTWRTNIPPRLSPDFLAGKELQTQNDAPFILCFKVNTLSSLTESQYAP